VGRGCAHRTSSGHFYHGDVGRKDRRAFSVGGSISPGANARETSLCGVRRVGANDRKRDLIQRGRVGDLLHICDSFPDPDLLMLVLRTMSSDSCAETDVDEDFDVSLRRPAETFLKRLSFRTLRGVSRLPDSYPSSG